MYRLLGPEGSSEPGAATLGGTPRRALGRLDAGPRAPGSLRQPPEGPSLLRRRGPGASGYRRRTVPARHLWESPTSPGPRGGRTPVGSLSAAGFGGSIVQPSRAGPADDRVDAARGLSDLRGAGQRATWVPRVSSCVQAGLTWKPRVVRQTLPRVRGDERPGPATPSWMKRRPLPFGRREPALSS